MKKIEKLILSGVIIGFSLCSSVFQGFSRSSGSYSCFCPLRDLSGCAVSSFGCRMTGLIRVI